MARATTRDVSDFRDHLRRDHGQAVASVNRALVTVRRFFSWLVDHGHLEMNPAVKVKELLRVQLAPKGLERSQVRRLLREVELRQDVRANAVFGLLLYTGCHVENLVSLEMHDLMIGERSGQVVFKHGKGGKQRDRAVTAAGEEGVDVVFGDPTAWVLVERLHRRTWAVDRSRHPGAL